MVDGAVAAPHTVPGLPPHSLRVVPSGSTKTVHFVRHAQGFHNVAGEADYANYSLDLYRDAHLTELGYQQAHALSRHVQECGLRVDLVVCSPLARTLETAVIAFGTHAAHSPAAEAADGARPPLMVERHGEPGVLVSHPPVYAHDAPPFVSHELCREHIGVHPCDARRPLSYSRSQFPGIDFSLVETEDDVQWTADRRELDSEVSVRGVLFLQWLMSRPERTIAVVSHCGFLQHALNHFAEDAGLDVSARLSVSFENAELRTMVIYDRKADGTAGPPADKTSFCGGPKVQTEAWL